MKVPADIAGDTDFDPAFLRGQPATLRWIGSVLVADTSGGRLQFAPWGASFGCHWSSGGRAQRIAPATQIFDRLGLWPRDATPCGLDVKSGAPHWHSYLLAIPAPIRRLAALYGPGQWRVLEQLAADPCLARRIDEEQARTARGVQSGQAQSCLVFQGQASSPGDRPVPDPFSR